MNCDGLNYRSTDIQTENIYFDLAIGYAEPAEVRGVDVTIPGAPGRTWMPKVGDLRLISLEGYVRGTGTTVDERQQSWRDATDALMALLDRTLAPGPLVVSGPYLGIFEGESALIEATCINVLPGPVQSTMTFQRWSVQLQAFDLDWEAGSSS